jgi:SAM-dependent methyltransferase
MSFTKNDHKTPISILDAGSGVTFFPFYLASIFQNSRVDCADFNTLPAILIPKINSMTDRSVGFYRTDIRALPFDNNTYDVIYCISVLEHTKSFPQIIQEFKRLLRPGGILLITFDISIDGALDIPLKLATELLHEVGRSFNSPVEIGDLSADSLVTTRFIRNFDPSLLPWKYPSIQFLKSFIKFRLPKTLFPNLTFYCVSVQNNS